MKRIRLACRKTIVNDSQGRQMHLRSFRLPRQVVQGLGSRCRSVTSTRTGGQWQIDGLAHSRHSEPLAEQQQQALACHTEEV
jgi:hypothetical protein